MNKISIKCPACAAVLKVSPDVIGKKARCPKCKNVVRLAASKDDPVATADSKSVPEDKQQPQSPSAAAPMAKPVPAAQSTTAPVAKPTTPAAVPMAKLLPAEQSAASSTSNQDGPVPTSSAETDTVNFSSLESSSSEPRVKFKRKRSNPLPTIILGVIAVAVLGIAVALIAILQSGNQQADPNALPEIVYVSDISAELGKKVSIPIQVKYPPAMTMQQTSEWKIVVGDEAPKGTVYDAQSNSVTWEPSYRQAGTSVVIPISIVNANTKKSNSTQFSVSVPQIYEGEKQFLAWVDKMETAGTSVNVSSRKTVAALSGQYRDASFHGITIRAYFYQSNEGPAAAAAGLDTESDAFKMAYEGLQAPLMVSSVQAMVLIGNMKEIKSDTSAAELFQTTSEDLPEIDEASDGEDTMDDASSEANEGEPMLDSDENL